MTHSLKEEILRNIDGLQDYAQQHEGRKTIRMLARRYHTTPQIVEKIIAEWSAGLDKDDEDDTAL